MPSGLNETPGMFVDSECPVEWDHPFNRGLVAWWNASPNSGWSGGNSFRDAVRGGKNPNDGALNTGVTWSSGNRTVKFNGSTGLITCPNAPNLNVAGANSSFSLVVWFKWVGPSGGSYVQLIDKGTGSSSRPFQLFFFGDGFSTFRFQQFNGSTNPYADTNSQYADGYWHQVVAVRDCVNSQMVMYVDGKNVTTSGSNVGFSTNFNDTGTVDFANLRNGVTGWYPGHIGSSQIFARALPAAQVNLLYQEQRKGSPTTLRWVSATTYPIPEQGGGATTGTPIFSSGLFTSRIIGGGGIVA